MLVQIGLGAVIVGVKLQSCEKSGIPSIAAGAIRWMMWSKLDSLTRAP